MKNLLLFIFCLSINSIAFGQAIIFNVAGGGLLPINWAEINGDVGNPIDRDTYYLLEADISGDTIETDTYDLSTYDAATLTMDIATFGGGSNNPAKIEISDDGGLNYTQITTTNTPSNSTYIAGGSIAINALTSQVKIRITNNGASGQGVRLKNIILEAIGPTAEFNAASSTETEGNAMLIPVTISNYSSGPVTLAITLGTANTGNNTYETGDITLNTTTLTFNGNGTDNVSITLNQDTDADDEMVEITISEQTATGINIGIGVHRLTIKDDELPTAGDLVINEINYGPIGIDAADEFIEIYNASGRNLNIGGVTFTNGINYTFPSGTTIDLAEYIIIASNSVTYSGNGYDVYEYSGGLSNSGETVTLEDESGNVIDAVTYGVSSPWLTSPNETGPTLSLFIANQNTTDNDNASSWGASCAVDGTPGIVNSNCSIESEIVAVDFSESLTISSLENTVSPLTVTDGVQVWQFTINEGGSDLADDDILPSIIDTLVISQNPILSGVTSLSDAVKSAAIFDGTTYLGTAVIALNLLTFSGSPLISIPDETSKTLSLRISLNENISQSNIDKKDFVFQITDENVTTPTDGTSSSFAFTTPKSTDNQNQIEVIATEISFTNQPTNTFKDNEMSDVMVSSLDANGNIDVDFETAVSVTSSGTLTGTPVSETAVSGMATFPTLTHTAIGTNFTLTAAVSGFSNAISNTFGIIEVSESPGDLIISEYMADPDGLSDFDGEYFELYNTTNTAIDIDGWIIKDDGSDSHTVSPTNGTTIISAYGFLVLGRSTDGNDNNTDVTLDYIYSGINLVNSSDEIILDANSTEICRLTYSHGNNFGAGVSHELINLSGHLTGITQGPTGDSDYQAATQPMLSGDLGSPGEMGQVLPVELLHFTAKPNNQTTTLTWATATEENNAYFNIQRSIDGKSFEMIGMKTGGGTIYEVQEYSFIDESPVNGLNYYRLQQVDFDGKFENHNIVSVIIADDKSAVTIVPTQVRNQFDIIFKESINANTQLEIYNINGQLVKSESLNINENRKKIDVNKLQAGVYIVRININNRIVAKRFVKL
jgi:hypothetical protein